MNEWDEEEVKHNVHEETTHERAIYEQASREYENEQKIGYKKTIVENMMGDQYHKYF